MTIRCTFYKSRPIVLWKYVYVEKSALRAKCKYLKNGEAYPEARKPFIIAFASGLKDFEALVRGEKISRSFSSNFQEMRATFETPARPKCVRKIKWTPGLNPDQDFNGESWR